MIKKLTRTGAIMALVCLALSFAIRKVLPSQLTSEQVAKVVASNLEKQLSQTDIEAKQLKTDSSQWGNAAHIFMRADTTTLLKWNNNDFIPDLLLLQDSFDVRWISTARGDFIIQKWTLANHRFLFAMIPLVERFRISNSFLEPQWNRSVFPASDIQIIDPNSSVGYPVSIDGIGTLFRVNISSPVALSGSGYSVALVLWWLGLVALLVSLLLGSYFLHKAGKPATGFLLLSSGLILIRVTSILFSIPDFYSDSLLFDPRVFASSALNPSIGDLFLNTNIITLLCIYLLFTYRSWGIVRKLIRLSEREKKGVAFVFVIIMFLAVLFPFLCIETIYHNSSISLDISQSIHWNDVRIVAFSFILISFVATFCFAHVFFRLFLFLTRSGRNYFVYFLLIGSLCMIAYSFALGRNYWITIVCGTSYFILLYVFRLSHTLREITYRTFFYFLLAIFLFTLQGALSIRRFGEERKINSQFRYASEFLVGRDFLGEFLLNESMARIKADPFIQTSFSNPFLSKSSIRQKVKQIYLNNYFDRYDVSIYLYNATGRPLDTQPFLDFASQVKNYQSTTNTGYDGVYFTSDSQNRNDRRYLMIVPVVRSVTPLGYIVIELAVKKRVPRNVYPELLVDNRFATYLQSSEYSYAIYAKEKLVSSFGTFNYDQNFKGTEIRNPLLYKEGLPLDQFIHIGVEDDAQRIAVVSSRDYPFFYVISNLSFWIVLCLLFVLVGMSLQGIYYWIRGVRVNYSLRVQLYFYSSLFLPLLVVSITTLSITTRSAATQLNDQFIDKAKLFGESLTPDLVERLQGGNDDDLNKRIRELAHVSDVDASVYDASGRLIGSNQRLIFDYQFKSEWIDPKAFHKIVYGRETSFVKEDQIGALKYFSAFCAVRSPRSGELMGIVSLPFFGSASSLEKTQINILMNILSVFTGVLLIFSVLSLFAADRLTYPLRIIARTLSRTTLTGHNEPLAWNSTDEIGVMVKEYNRMVQNLEQSKIELTRSQKESAWREMARQVAHEIKNPLTPIKLSLQQMEQWIKNEGAIPKERAERSIKTLLTQVEILNEIASSFSTFARMPSPVMIPQELNSIVKKTIDLYANNPTGKMDWMPYNKPVFIMGDEQLLMRIFSNLILNALQSGGPDQPVTVTIQIKVEQQKCIVTIEDNGSGMPDDMIEKIFIPYFTTKKSGSGLGLAIVKQGVEQSNGLIRIQSREGKGTTFYIEFPVLSKA